MSADAERYPLYWPEGQPRASTRREADFKVDFARARDELLHSLELLGGRNVILSTSVPLRRDGLPFANMSEPSDPGVAVYFDRWVRAHNTDGAYRPFVIACDTYTKVRWNLRAIGATVEALRSIKRHGASSMLEQAFKGFAALPAHHVDEPWWTTLGLARDARADVVRVRFRELAAIHHPDKGGDAATMSKITRAYHEAIGASPP